MNKLREIEVQGGDFELIRLAEDFAFHLGDSTIEEYYKKTELQKLKDAKNLLVEWEKISEEEFESKKNFLDHYGFEYGLKELV